MSEASGVEAPWEYTKDEELRQEALRCALRGREHYEASAIVERAQEFLAFLKGQEVEQGVWVVEISLESEGGEDEPEPEPAPTPEPDPQD
jgi:hypothetical protein